MNAIKIKISLLYTVDGYSGFLRWESRVTDEEYVTFFERDDYERFLQENPEPTGSLQEKWMGFMAHTKMYLRDMVLLILEHHPKNFDEYAHVVLRQTMDDGSFNVLLNQHACRILLNLYEHYANHSLTLFRALDLKDDDDFVHIE